MPHAAQPSLARRGRWFSGALGAGVAVLVIGHAASPAGATDCQGASVTIVAVADAWVDEDSPTSTKGGDSVLSVEAGATNVDTGVIRGRSRALVRFPMPAGIPEGCVLESARLRIYASEEEIGTRVQALALAAPWAEGTVSWANQPASSGPASVIWSRAGTMQWNVTAVVEPMLETGAGHGFVIRDAAEGDDLAGGGHGFYSREKGQPGTAPELVIVFGPPPSSEPPGPPPPPSPTAVACGQVITRSTLLTNSLGECAGDGLVIGAPRIIVDLGGHVVDGIGLGAGVRNDGFTGVTVRNGTIRQFDYGVELAPETTDITVQGLALVENQVAAIELFDVVRGRILDNTLDANGGGILLVSGTRESVVAANTITRNGGAGIFLRDAADNRIEDNHVSGGGDLGIGLERSSRNALTGNASAGNSDGGIELRDGSHDNRLEGNTVTDSGDHGIWISASHRTILVGNVAHFMSDSGITLDTADDGVIRDNDVRFNTGGLELDGASGNLISGNDASETSGIGIELGGGSLRNRLESNIANRNKAQGIYLGDEARGETGLVDPLIGNVLVGNTASGNGADGIGVPKAGHTLVANVARDNLSWGIHAATTGTVDGGRNAASGNGKPEQCQGVVCRDDWDPPETLLNVAPPAATRSTTARFEFTGTDDRSAPGALRFRCSLDGGAFVACASPVVRGSLADGSHTFAVVATDAAGNTDPSPAQVTWSVDGTPPSTTFGDAPDDPSGVQSATFSFDGADNATDADALAFECRLDGAAIWSPCVSPVRLEGLTEGWHAFEARAVDAAGNVDPLPPRHPWAVDLTPPETSVAAGPPSPTRDTHATVTFSANEPATFVCALDDGPAEPCVSPIDYAGLAEGAHTVTVRATDAAGNREPGAAARTWTIDRTPPRVSVDAAPETLVNTTGATFAFAADEPAAIGCSLDQEAFASCASPITLSDLSEGGHTFEIRATDAAGNVGSAVRHDWMIDVTPPSTAFDDAPPAVTSAVIATFAFSSNETASFDCALDGGSFEPCASEVALADLPEGDHAFAVRAIDAASNLGPAIRHDWTVDRTPPTVRVDSGPAHPTNSSSARIAFSADEPATFACSVDDAPYAPCTSPQDSGELPEGEHRIRVLATDRAGNTGAATTHAWTIDVTPPTVALDFAPSDPTNATSARFAFSTGEAATFACSLDGGAFEACSSPLTQSNLVEGTHTLAVRATDAAGNESAAAEQTWTIDVTPPDTSVAGGPSDPSGDATATFAFAAGEAATFACSVDDGPFVPCVSPGHYSGFEDGRHTFRVVAVDAAGNRDESPAVHAWTVDTVPPETVIGDGPDDPTNATTATFAFSADEPGRFECSLDGSAFTPCSSPVAHAGLADGAHAFEVRALDLAGNLGPAARHGWRVDVTAPTTTVDERPADPTDAATASIAFSANEPATFVCALDGAPLATCTSPVVYDGLADGPHEFRVRATDVAGNAESASAGIAWTVDTAAPRAAIDAGPANPTSATAAVLEFSTDEPASFACSLDGSPFAVCSSPQTYTELPDGDHVFRVRATDTAGNADALSAIHAWTVDATSPGTTITDGPADPSDASSAAFIFTATEPATFECALDEGPYESCASPRSYAGLTAGVHAFAVRATDAVGNVDETPATHAWTIETDSGDVTAPHTAIGTGPAGVTTSRSASFTFTADEPATFECALDAGAFTACTSPQGYHDLADGTHAFAVRAIDPAGNVDGTPATRDWSVDGTPPQTTIDGGPSGPTAATSATFTFSADEPVTFACSLDNAAFAACTSPRQYTGLASGAHSVRVRATDPAGNVDASPATRNWTVDIAAPNTTITAGPTGTVTARTAVFSFTSSESTPTFECALDAAAFAACTSPRDYAGLAVGSHTFRVRAIDSAGNVDASPATRTWTIQSDSAPPNTTITGGPSGTLTEPEATFTFTASESGSTFQCALDAAAFGACTSPHRFTGLPGGIHTFRVRAIDPAGNVDATPAIRTWTVEIISGCGALITLTAVADAWVEQNSPSSNRGSDSILKVKSQGPADNFRALVRFSLPALPSGCRVESATLRLYAASATLGRTLHAQRLTSSWTESSVTWDNQPTTTGTAATAPSGLGYREWNVSDVVGAMLQPGSSNHGFVIRDAAEGSPGAEQSIHARDKGSEPPQLVIRLAETPLPTGSGPELALQPAARPTAI